MLEHLKKQISKLITSPEVIQEFVTTEKETTMVADNPALTELQSSFDALTLAFAEANSEVTRLTALVAAEAQAKVDAQAEQLATKMTARKELIVKAVGTDRADALFTATEVMSDTSFSTLMSAMSTASVAEAKTELFTEVGVDGPADVSKVVADAESNPTKAILMAKYAPKQ